MFSRVLWAACFLWVRGWLGVIWAWLWTSGFGLLSFGFMGYFLFFLSLACGHVFSLWTFGLGSGHLGSVSILSGFMVRLSSFGPVGFLGSCLACGHFGVAMDIWVRLMDISARFLVLRVLSGVPGCVSLGLSWTFGTFVDIRVFLLYRRGSRGIRWACFLLLVGGASRIARDEFEHTSPNALAALMISGRRAPGLASPSRVSPISSVD